MLMVKAIVRPEKVYTVIDALYADGFRAVTKVSVLGRGKQRGLKAGEITYDELPKELLMIVIEDKDLEKVENVIIAAAKSGKNGSFGDGKIFVVPVEKAITISSGKAEL